jgi:hypothetical protein
MTPLTAENHVTLPVEQVPPVGQVGNLPTDCKSVPSSTGSQVPGPVSTPARDCDPVSEPPITLAARLSRGDLEAREILRYATDVAADLAARHRAGHAHGAISPEAVLLAGGSARLEDPPQLGISVGLDAVQFAALLRVMARACAAPERAALGAALGALCGRYLNPEAGPGAQSFKKLLLALKVLRVQYWNRVPAAVAPPLEILPATDPAGSRPAPEPSKSRRRKIRILIRALPSATQLIPYRQPEPRPSLWRKLRFLFLGR